MSLILVDFLKNSWFQGQSIKGEIPCMTDLPTNAAFCLLMPKLIRLKMKYLVFLT